MKVEVTFIQFKHLQTIFCFERGFKLSVYLCFTYYILLFAKNLYMLIFVKFLLLCTFLPLCKSLKQIKLTTTRTSPDCAVITMYLVLPINTSFSWHLTSCEEALRCELFCIYALASGSLSSKIAYRLASTHLAKGSLLPDLLVHQ